MAFNLNTVYFDLVILLCCFFKICAGGSVTSLSRSLLKNEQHLEEYLIAHILKETVNVGF